MTQTEKTIESLAAEALDIISTLTDPEVTALLDHLEEAYPERFPQKQ